MKLTSCFGAGGLMEEKSEELSIPLVTLSPSELNRFLLEMRKTGKVVTKWGSDGKPQIRIFTIDEKSTRLTYHPTRKSVAQVAMSIKDIRSIIPGQKTKIFRRAGEKAAGAENYSFSIIDKNGRGFHLQVNEAKDVQLWIQTLSYVVRRSSGLVDNNTTRVKVMELWDEPEVESDARKTVEEVSEMLRDLNVQVEYHALVSEFQKFDVDKSGKLDFNEFQNFFQQLTKRPEVESIFARYARRCKRGQEGEDYITLNELAVLFRNEYHIKTDEAIQEAKLAIQRGLTGKEEAPPDGENLKAVSRLGLHEFVQYMCSTEVNSWVNEKSFKRVHMDMRHPIHCYFVATSHHTFSTGDQLQAPSTVDQYRTVLQMGCRNLELVLWDGPKGDIRVGHGHNRSPSLDLKEVLKAIGQDAFVKTEYPLILTLEIHCNYESQCRLAMLLAHCLNTQLVPAMAFGETELSHFSPEYLKGKILIQCRGATQEDTTYKDTDDHKDISGMPEESIHHQVEVITAEITAHRGRLPIARDLANMVNIKTVAFRGLEEMSAQPSPFENYKLCENQLSSVEGQLEEMAQLNKKTTARVYPAGARFQSSNIETHKAWGMGIQFAAMNYQTMDPAMRVHQAFFATNGGCGYVLKPPYLRHAHSHSPDMRSACTLTLRIISGSQLPKPGRQRKGEVIDPYVVIRICGIPQDNCERQTSVIENNGFHPLWDERFEFTLTCPSMAVLVLRVMDKDAHIDEEIAEACIHVECIRTGYRAVPLWTTETNTKLESASLFVWSQMAKIKTEAFT